MPENVTPRDAWDVAAMQQPLSQAECEFRDRFVNEYLVDYDAFRATIRMGFLKDFASDTAAKMMCDPYVQRQIKVEEAKVQASGTVKDDARVKQVMASLFEQAHFHGHGASHGARVSALKTIADILGMNAPVKTEAKVDITQTVQFYLPSNGRDPQAAPPAEPAPVAVAP